MRLHPNQFLASALLACLSVPAQAAITYVDAAEGASGNTFATGDSLSDPPAWQDATGGEDTWRKRSDAVLLNLNGGSIFEALHETTTSDDIPELTTRISGLADGTYTVWAFYWDQIDSGSQNWTLSAGLVSGSLTSYRSPGQPTVPGATTSNVTYAGDLTFSNSVEVDGYNDGNATLLRQLFGVELGEVTVSGGAGTIDVYVDNLVGNGSVNRTWYEGVGYELVPEPTTAALLGLSCLGLLRHRRRS